MKKRKFTKELMIELAVILVAGIALLLIFRYEDVKSFFASVLN